MKTHKNQKGFVIFPTIMALVVVVAVGLVGWYVMKVNRQSNESANSSDYTQRTNLATERSANSEIKPTDERPTKTVDNKKQNDPDANSSITPTDKTQTNASNDNTATPINKLPVTQPPAKPKPQTFNIESFYEAIQTGMSLNEVKTLANGRSGDCKMTNSMPSYTHCSWRDGDKYVQVNFGADNKVANKTKAGF